MRIAPKRVSFKLRQKCQNHSGIDFFLFAEPLPIPLRSFSQIYHIHMLISLFAFHHKSFAIHFFGCFSSLNSMMQRCFRYFTSSFLNAISMFACLTCHSDNSFWCVSRAIFHCEHAISVELISILTCFLLLCFFFLALLV